MRHIPDDRGDYGVGAAVDTRQEAADRNVLLHAPEKTQWLSPQRVLARLSDTTSERHRIRLFDSLNLHKLYPSARNYRTEHEFFFVA